jgi:hypothetical protein
MNDSQPLLCGAICSTYIEISFINIGKKKSYVDVCLFPQTFFLILKKKVHAEKHTIKLLNEKGTSLWETKSKINAKQFYDYFLILYYSTLI